MTVKRSQQTSTELTRTQSRQVVLRAARQLDTEADLYRELPTDGAEDGAGVAVVTPQQWHAVRLLVAGKRGVDVAQECCVSAETVSRWKASPLFAAALNLALRESYSATVGEIRGIAQDACTVLRESLCSTDERLRLSAALAVLRMSLQLDAGAQALPTTPALVAEAEQQEIQNTMLRSAFSFG